MQSRHTGDKGSPSQQQGVAVQGEELTRDLVKAAYQILRTNQLTYADTVTLLEIVDETRRALALNATRVEHPFELVYDSAVCSLEARPGSIGLYEVRFTLKAPRDGKKLSFSDAVDQCADVLNQEMRKLPHWPVEYDHKIHMSHNWLPTTPLEEDWVLTYTPVVIDSGSRARTGLDPNMSHEGLLKKLGCTFVEWADIHRLACGAWRIYRGFPNDSTVIGTSRDPGDLMEGKIIRTAKGTESGSSVCYRMGIGSADWADEDIVSCIVVAAVPLTDPNAMKDEERFGERPSKV